MTILLWTPCSGFNFLATNRLTAACQFICEPAIVILYSTLGFNFSVRRIDCWPILISGKSIIDYMNSMARVAAWWGVGRDWRLESVQLIGWKVSRIISATKRLFLVGLSSNRNQLFRKRLSAELIKYSN